MLFIPDETRARLRSVNNTEYENEKIIINKLRAAGLRPTKQRILLASILFGTTHRHVTADSLFQDIQLIDQHLSLATIYNTLHHFSEVGLLRRICTSSERVYFNTDTGNHHHFYIKEKDKIIDIPKEEIIIQKLPVAPDGYEIASIDVIIHLKAK
ncbi:iron response transcriptional regulator IrrA [Brucellaceae bacterium C25G]